MKKIVWVWILGALIHSGYAEEQGQDKSVQQAKTTKISPETHEEPTKFSDLVKATIDLMGPSPEEIQDQTTALK